MRPKKNISTLKLHHHKHTAASQSVRIAPPKEVLLPMTMHAGAPAEPIVAVGDYVRVGQKIAERGEKGFSSPVHATVSGTVTAIEPYTQADGRSVQIIRIESDGKMEKDPAIKPPVANDVEEFLEVVAESGIVGLGGAAFPLWGKLAAVRRNQIDTVLINGAECEPYITCDDQLMRTCPEEIVEGLEIILKLFPNAVGIIGIEKNKPQAIAAMQSACAGHEKISVLPLKTKYPQGGERSLISVVANKHLKLGMLPADAGCVVDNVATIRAIYRAVCLNEPLMERTVTVSGDCVKDTGNFFVKIGTLSSELVQAVGGWKEGLEPKKILFGGPMMGVALQSLEVPVCKNNNAITALSYDTVAESTTTACLRCGRCNRVCPLGLSPQLMQVAALRKNYDRYENRLYGLECIACGCCTYICPAKRPLMQLFKVTKAEIMAAKKK